LWDLSRVPDRGSARDHGELGRWPAAGRFLAQPPRRLLGADRRATVRRAQPFPVPPEGFDGERFSFNVPVKFNIR
jgi:hypothetical protein